MARLVIVSNRVPPPKERTTLAGGLAVALKDALRGRETLWFGWSGKTVAGEPDRPHVVKSGRVTYALFDLPEGDFRGYYQGFANGTLWPLLHSRMGLTEFRRSDLAAYRRVNEAFASALLPLLRPDDTIWVHDYHLIPLGAALRRLGVADRIGFFLHIPFPPPSLFSNLPQSESLLRDLGAYDVIGVQGEADARHVIEAMTQAGIAGYVQAFPIGIDPQAFADAARKAEGGEEYARLRDSTGGRALMLGVDRLDYSKGLPQRFQGYAALLRRFPEHRNKVTFLQVAPVSRGDVAQYKALRKELDELAGRINGEFAEIDWVPLRWMTRGVSRNVLAGFFRLAQVAVVTPLRDGMNLVAKEYVAAQDDEHPGALVLSKFAGAAAELGEGALLCNPFDPDEIAEALHRALGLSEAERRVRMRRMKQAVEANTAAHWAQRFLAELEGRTARAA
jgi:trehalose 6-phosphate synthase